MPRPVSHGRAAFGRLLEWYGRDTVAGWLRDDMEAAPHVKLKRKRGRPPGAKYDDTLLLQAATAHWRQAGRGNKVWPALLAVSPSESGARRLLYRLDEWGVEGCTQRGIGDFYAALCAARDERALAKFEAKVAVEMGCGKRQAHEWVAAMFGVIVNAIARGENVTLRGFGTFYTAHGRVGFHSALRLKAAVEIEGSLRAGS